MLGWICLQTQHVLTLTQRNASAVMQNLINIYYALWPATLDMEQEAENHAGGTVFSFIKLYLCDYTLHSSFTDDTFPWGL